MIVFSVRGTMVGSVDVNCIVLVRVAPFPSPAVMSSSLPFNELVEGGGGGRERGRKKRKNRKNNILFLMLSMNIITVISSLLIVITNIAYAANE